MQIYSSNRTRLNYLYLNMDDLSQETARMDDFEELVYFRLFFQYLNKMELPADTDKLKRIVRLRHADEEQTKQAIEAFLALDGVLPSQEQPGIIHYVLWDAIIASTIERFDRMSASGTNAAKSRWGARNKQPEVADEPAA